jgi:hypothetical protein
MPSSRLERDAAGDPVAVVVTTAVAGVERGTRLRVVTLGDDTPDDEPRRREEPSRAHHGLEPTAELAEWWRAHFTPDELHELASAFA